VRFRLLDLHLLPNLRYKHPVQDAGGIIVMGLQPGELAGKRPMQKRTQGKLVRRKADGVAVSCRICQG